MSDLEIELMRYSKRTWLKSGLLGVIIGLAVIVPGISGSTVAIIFKLYRQFLYAIGHLFEKFKKCFVFLLPIGLGCIVGLVGGLIAVKTLLKILTFAVICLFSGLMVGSFPAVKDEIKGVKFNFLRILLLCVGILIPVAIGVLSGVLKLNELKQASEGVVDVFAKVKVWQVLLSLVVGYVIAITQVVPGLSASAILMAIGWYTALMDSIGRYWLSNPWIFFIYAGLGIGFVAGLITFSRLFDLLLKKAKGTTMCLVVGMAVGSIVSMFCNGDVMEVYAGWAKTFDLLAVVNVVLGVLLFAVGVVGAYLLVRLQRKKDAELEK